MNIIIIEDSTGFIRHLVDQLLKIKKENDQIIVLCCKGSYFNQPDFDNNKTEFKQVNWHLADNQAELKEKLSIIVEKDCNYVIATDLTLFFERGLKYEDYGSIKTIIEMIKESKLETKKVTIYSQGANFEEIKNLFNDPIKTYIRPGMFDSDEIRYFYNLITKISSL